MISLGAKFISYQMLIREYLSGEIRTPVDSRGYPVGTRAGPGGSGGEEAVAGSVGRERGTVGSYAQGDPERARRCALAIDDPGMHAT